MGNNNVYNDMVTVNVDHIIIDIDITHIQLTDQNVYNEVSIMIRETQPWNPVMKVQHVVIMGTFSVIDMYMTGSLMSNERSHKMIESSSYFI